MKSRLLFLCLTVLLGIGSSIAAQEKVGPIIIDYRGIPDSLEQGIKAADLVALVRIADSHSVAANFPQTEFDAEVLEVLSHSKGIEVGPTIRILRIGGLVNIKGRQYFQEERGFPIWPLGAKLVVFLSLNKSKEAFYPIAGPEFSFEEDSNGHVQSSGRRQVASSFKGRPFGELVASIRSEVR